MVGGNNHRVELSDPEAGLDETMSQIRLWLDSHRIQPNDFRFFPSEHGVRFQITFATEDEAVLFTRWFSGERSGRLG